MLSLLVLAGVALMLQRTRTGKAIRAVSDNRDLAESSGIDVSRVILNVWLLAGGLAALGGVFFGLALLLGIPTLRLRADYLAITTIAAGEILRYAYRSNFASPVTGGVYGLTRFADPIYAINPIPAGRYGFGQLSFSERSLWIMVISWSLVALACVLMFVLIRSP